MGARYGFEFGLRTKRLAPPAGAHLSVFCPSQKHPALAGGCSGGDSDSRDNGFGGRASNGSKTGKPLRACLKTRPVRAPGLQATGFSAKSCRPRALTRRFPRVFKHALKRLCRFACPDTRLKPGANEMGNRLQGTELRRRRFGKRNSQPVTPGNHRVHRLVIPHSYFSGQPPCCSIAWSICAIRRPVSDKA